MLLKRHCKVELLAPLQKWLGMSKELLTEEHLRQRTFRAENQPNPTFKGSNHRLVDDDDHKAPIMCQPPPTFCRQSSSKRAEDQEGQGGLPQLC